MDSLAQQLEQRPEADELRLAFRAPVGEAPELLELDRVLVALGQLPDLLLDSDTLGFEQKCSCTAVRERILHLRKPCLIARGRVEERANLVQQKGEIVRHRRLSSIEPLPPGDHGPVGLSSPVRRPTRWLIAVLLSALALATAGAAPAALSGELTRALTVRGVSWQATGVLVLDLRNGGLVYAKHADRSLRPASNEKLVVALAALDRLGPAARIPTRVLGRGSASESVWQGALILKGYGDPTLTRSDLAVLAKRVRLSGITTVTGKVLADETYFDTRRVAPGWKPSFYKEECPPLSALVVDKAKVLGRTVDTPALAAARAFRRALMVAGVRVLRGAGVGAAGDGDTLVSQILSPSTAGLVRQMNRQSDNFVAEMLLKRLGARVLDRGADRGRNLRGPRGPTNARGTARRGPAGGRLRPLELRPPDREGHRRHPGHGLERPRLSLAVREIAATRGRERHPEGPLALVSRPRFRSGEDRDDQPGLDPFGLRGDALCLLGTPERSSDPLALGETGPGPIRADSRGPRALARRV